MRRQIPGPWHTLKKEQKWFSTNHELGAIEGPFRTQEEADEYTSEKNGELFFAEQAFGREIRHSEDHLVP